ncbi:hypothetical protein KEM54_000577 [Ascosphaera aggregata]|nr:hypothetical protein KEM54_000577 [Ascosphaera aggregata]
MTEELDSDHVLNAEFDNSERHLLLSELSRFAQRAAFGSASASASENASKSEDPQSLQKQQQQLFEPELLANLWLCDTKRLTEFVETLRCAADSYRDTIMFGLATQSHMSASAKKYKSSLSSDVHSESATSKCLKRDSKRCILTNAEHAIEAAHIIPLSLHTDLGHYLNKTDELHTSFFNALQLFWRDEIVNEWLQPLKDGLECCENMITLQPMAREYYRRGLFALLPECLSEDKKELTVRFYWLPHSSKVEPPTFTRPPHIPSLSTATTTTTTPTKGHRDGESDLCTLYDAKTGGGRLISGQKIVLRTADPISEPLPSLELLRLQWIYQRLKLITVAGELKMKEDERRRDIDDMDEWVYVEDHCYDSPVSSTSAAKENGPA